MSGLSEGQGHTAVNDARQKGMSRAHTCKKGLESV